MKTKTILLVVFIISTLKLSTSNIVFYETIGGYSVKSNYITKVFDNNIYFLNSEGVQKVNFENHELIFDFTFIGLRENDSLELVSYKILREDIMAFGFSKQIKEGKYLYHKNTELYIYDNNNMYKFDSTNAPNLQGKISDFILGDDGEVAITSSTNKIGFYKDGELEFYDCGDNFSCMPEPFMINLGGYYRGCYYYSSSNSNVSLNCNREYSRTISREEFNVNNSQDFRLQNHTVYDDKLWLANDYLNQISIIDGDDITTFSPLSEEDNVKYRIFPEIPLLIHSFLWGNDGYFYALYKHESIQGGAGPAAASVVFKMDKDYNILEVLDIPQVQGSPFIKRLHKDESDPTNLKVYITTSQGMYIYDPTATSVDEKTDDGPGALFVSQVYPNPANTFINVRYGADMSNHKNIEVYVTNILGQRIKTFEDAGFYSNSTGYGSANYDISDLPTGQYLLVLTDGNNFETESIIIQR